VEFVSIILLFLAGFTGGFIDSIAGGGGLVTLPVLLGLGIPPHFALGTNKFQASFGSFSSTYNFMKKGIVSFKEVAYGVVMTFIGAATGTVVIQLIEADFLKKVIPVLLIGILIYLVFTPSLGKSDKKSKINETLFFSIFGILLGFYDGFFGPGTGNFWVVLIMVLLGFNMTKATGYTKVMNFTSNFTSLIVFIIGGKILFTYGLVMAAGQFIGARVGSSLAIKKGSSFIKPIFLMVVTVMIVVLSYRSYFE
jgi:uncharacterized membrane protein YfcA